MAKVLEHRKFVCVEFGETNNNKVWQITLHDNDDVMVEWGRVGKALQNKTHNLAGRRKFDSLIREKTNPNNKPDKLYTEVKTVGGTIIPQKPASVVTGSELRTIAQKQIKTTNTVVSSLIDFLVKVNAHNILTASGGRITYNTDTATFQTPLGVIDPEQVKDARQLLQDMADFVAAGRFSNDSFNTKLNQYLRLIPHDVGMRKISPSLILPDLAAVQKENDLLDGLDASFVSAKNNAKQSLKKNAADSDTEPKVFQIELDLLNGGDPEVGRIERYYEKTKSTMHQSYRYRLDKVYVVKMPTLMDAFDKKGKPLGNIKELFHGTKASNLLSIFKGGLIIPPANSSHCTGRMYGNGIYASDISSKALNYATGYWSVGGNTSRVFMFVVEFAMGKEFIPTSSYGYNYPVSGYHSTFAKAGRSGVINNEMIVYYTWQCNLKYLLEFK